MADEMQEKIQSEHEINQAEQDPCGDDRFLCFFVCYHDVEFNEGIAPGLLNTLTNSNIYKLQYVFAKNFTFSIFPGNAGNR